MMGTPLIVAATLCFGVTAYFALKTYNHANGFLSFWSSGVESILQLTPGLQLVRGTVQRDDDTVTAPLTDTECLAYEATIQDATGSVKRRLSDSVPFFVLDGTGSAYVKPDAADFIPNTPPNGEEYRGDPESAVTETSGTVGDRAAEFGADITSEMQYVERRVESPGLVSVFGTAVPWKRAMDTLPESTNPREGVPVIQKGDSPFLIANAARPLLSSMFRRTVLAGTVTAVAAILTVQLGLLGMFLTYISGHVGSFGSVTQADYAVGAGTMILLVITLATGVYQYYWASKAPWAQLSYREIALMWAPVFGIVTLAYFTGQLTLGGLGSLPALVVFVAAMLCVALVVRFFYKHDPAFFNFTS